MILTCPECGTHYSVKDGAIPDGGRKVRCASCGHSWHQDPEQFETEGKVEPAAGEGADDLDMTEPEGPIAETASSDQPEVDLAEPPAAVPVPPPGGWEEAVAGEQDWDPEKELPDEEEIEALRTETGADRKRSWLMGVVFAIALVGLIVVALFLVAPDSLRKRLGFAAAAPTPLQIAPGAPERQRLESGNELVVVSGRVINPSGETQQVPAIEAQLRDSSGKLIHSWTIAPPARTLPPGGSANFNSAEMNVPPSGLDSTVTLTLKG